MTMMKEQWANAKIWWFNLASRERQAVMWGGAMVGIFIVYQWIWTPLVDHVALLRNRIHADKATLVWMEAADEAIKKGERQGQKKQATSAVVMLSELQKEINQAGLGQSLAQLRQSGDDSIEMQFQKVEFDRLMKLLISVLKTKNATITQLSAIPDNVSGMVNAEVIVKLG
ncbi:MAG: type II secretion system protein M [Gammaproteobacteria bacterium]|nr:MAG: type II secretion system protein M [Gammaproteobacteria bacterium]